MAPFSIPTPAIIPLRLPVFGGPKSIDTKTKIEILCETYLDHEIFYTIDGTRPQPYAGIVQGNKTIKYFSPFCLPAGKITIKAIAINSVVHTMCSSVVTKCFEVLKVECEDDDMPKTRKSKNSKPKNNSTNCGNKNLKVEKDKEEEKIPDTSNERLECESIPESEPHTNCLEEAFIGSTDFELSHENDIEDSSCYLVHQNKLDINDNLELSETLPCNLKNLSYENDSVFVERMEKLTLEPDKNMNPTNRTLTDSGTSIETQFCCLKCDLTLQQCSNCNKMNAVSSKFCIGCGEQLLQICHFCKEWNPVLGSFCQFCGKKLGCRMEPYIKLNQLDQSVTAKPETKNASTEVSLTKAEKSVQTECGRRNSGKRCSQSPKRMPRISPGRGYWHQQLDFICNHLKSHAYNNVEFRREISEPSLCDFKSAHIVKEENNIVVSLCFTPFVPGKIFIPTSEDIKTEDNHPKSS